VPFTYRDVDTKNRNERDKRGERGSREIAMTASLLHHDNPKAESSKGQGGGDCSTHRHEKSLRIRVTCDYFFLCVTQSRTCVCMFLGAVSHYSWERLLTPNEIKIDSLPGE